MGFGWTSSNATVDIILYSKAKTTDANWTEIKRINTNKSSGPLWIPVPTINGNACFRIEVARTSATGTTKAISAIKLLSMR